MSNDRVNVYRVEVLGDNVQKYSSTTVHGGGGYVATVNGTTYGQSEQITSSVQHHVDQDIWVKDLETGREFQINLKDVAFPVRAGHVLRVVFDDDSNRWERLYNEVTGQMGYGQGFANPEKAQEYRNQKHKGYLYALGLSIPFVNWLVGLVALKLLLTATPTTLYGEKLPGAGSSILFTFLAGLGLFVFGTFGFVVFIVEPAKWGFFTKLLTFLVYGGSLYAFLKFFPLPWSVASEFIDRRSNHLDALLKGERNPVTDHA